jgi:predicted DCC family thiol-disulfide oxidoreductase YuxK
LAVRLAGEETLRREPLAGDVADRYLSHLTPEQRSSRAWLVAPDGRRWSGPEAIWHALYLAPRLGPLLRPLRWIPGFRPISDVVYGWIATHRNQLGCRIDRR